MAVLVEVAGANGVPPSVMGFSVMLSGPHLEQLLVSAASMPEGRRGVPLHLREVLEALLSSTVTVADPVSAPSGSGSPSDPSTSVSTVGSGSSDSGYPVDGEA